MRVQPSTRFLALALALALGGAGCASGGGGSGSRPAGATANRIVQAELDQLQQLNAYEAIERLRANWFRTRSNVPPTLYVDGARRTSIRDLEGMLAVEVARMERLSAGDASNRYGTGHAGGAILVTTC